MYVRSLISKFTNLFRRASVEDCTDALALETAKIDFSETVKKFWRFKLLGQLLIFIFVLGLLSKVHKKESNRKIAGVSCEKRGTGSIFPGISIILFYAGLVISLPIYSISSFLTGKIVLKSKPESLFFTTKSLFISGNDWRFFLARVLTFCTILILLGIIELKVNYENQEFVEKNYWIVKLGFGFAFITAICLILCPIFSILQFFFPALESSLATASIVVFFIYSISIWCLTVTGLPFVFTNNKP